MTRPATTWAVTAAVIAACLSWCPCPLEGAEPRAGSAAVLLLGRPPDAPVDAETPATPDTAGLADLSPEELFVCATAAELQFAALVAPARSLLIRNHETSLPYLVAQLDADGTRERHGLESIMVEIGEPAVLPLVDAVRREARRTDTTKGARLAVGILGKIGDPRAFDALVELHGHENWKVRSSAGEALGRIAEPAALTTLLGMLADENEMVRKSAAVAARRILSGADNRTPSEDAVAALAAALHDPHYSVRYGAADALAEVGEPAVRHLLAVVSGADGAPRYLAILALGEIRAEAALRPLHALLESDDWATRAYASEAIGRIGPDRRIRKDLARMLRKEQHPFVILKATEALAPAGS
jgi:HEAT repeat protein